MTQARLNPFWGRRSAPRPGAGGPEAPSLSIRVVGLALDQRGAPASLDDKSRSVEVVAATESPAQVYDWTRGEVVDEVLLMSGLDPVPAQVPLLDAHNRWGVDSVLGSVRDFRVEGGSLLARAQFSSSAETAYTLMREGHLTDVSVGYRVDGFQWIDKGKQAVVNGKTYSGPLRVVTKWSLGEVSAVPIGADPDAKARAAANQTSKERNMEKWLREYLESRGLAKDASEDEAWRFLSELGQRASEAGAGQERGQHRQEGQEAGQQAGQADDPPPAPAPARGEEPPAQRGAAAPGDVPAQERQRAAEIMGMCRAAGLGHEATAELIAGPLNADQAARQVLERQAQASGIAGGAGYRAPARVTQDERDKFRAAGVDSLLARGGLAVAQPAAGHDELMGFTLKELARECLRRAGLRANGHDLDMLGRALTTSDLPNILQNVVNRSVMAGWEGAPETWPLWCAEGSVSDFKPGTGVRLSEFDGLNEMKEEDEYQYDKFSDAQETYQIATYGKGFRISRRTLINDDLGLLTGIPMAMGEAASRTVGDVAWASLIANGAMGDGKALFHADHGNLANIAHLDVDGLGQIIQLMTSQKDMAGKRRIRIVPGFIFLPTALYVTSEKFFGSDVIGTAQEPNIKNPFTGTFKQENRIYEPRLDDANTSVFYLAGPKGRTVTVFFLNGVKTPFLDAQDDWNTDGRKYKVRIDVGSKAMDWRGLAKATITG